MENKKGVTPKDFFLWAGAMIAFYWSVIAFILLIFDYINYAFPNPLAYLAANPYDSGIGTEMASIIVMFPICVLLMWLIRRDIAHDHSRRDIWVRRWALILTLFLAGITIAGDLIVLLAVFFAGNVLTVGFLLKTAVLLLIAAGVFMHFIADYWGYWEKNASRRVSVVSATAVLAALTIVAGFVMFGTPNKAREYRYDEQRVQDLQTIQSQIVSYWQEKAVLPASLSDLSDSISGFTVPADPVSGASYEYQAEGSNSFELCATFAATALGNSEAGRYAPGSLGGGGSELFDDNWYHGAGRTCFARTIDPERYPPIKKEQATKARAAL